MAQLELEPKKSALEVAPLTRMLYCFSRRPLTEQLTPLLESRARLPSLTSWQVVILIAVSVPMETTRTQLALETAATFLDSCNYYRVLNLSQNLPVLLFPPIDPMSAFWHHTDQTFFHMLTVKVLKKHLPCLLLEFCFVFSICWAPTYRKKMAMEHN